MSTPIADSIGQHADRPWWCAPCKDADGHECPITLTAAAAP